MKGEASLLKQGHPSLMRWLGRECYLLHNDLHMQVDVILQSQFFRLLSREKEPIHWEGRLDAF